LPHPHTRRRSRRRFNDFTAPGTQPLTVTDNFATPDICAACHSGYGQPTVEPVRNWSGSMMAQAGRDPLMWAAHAISKPGRARIGRDVSSLPPSKGWLEGRSVPADGTGDDDRRPRNGVQVLGLPPARRILSPIPTILPKIPRFSPRSRSR
jgi:hypothetical protein